jgi:hypothetical protein
MNFCRSRFSTRGNSIRFLKFFNRGESTYKLYLNSQLLLTRNQLFQKLLVKSYQIQLFFSFLQFVLINVTKLTQGYIYIDLL